MILRIDHIALAVKDYPRAKAFFESIFDLVPGASASVPHTKYEWHLMSLGDLSRLELLHPTSEGSFLDGFLKNREGGVHHITFQASDLLAVKARLDELKIPYFGYNEYPGGIWKELFIHPRDAFGVLIQIAEFEAKDWLNPSVNLKKNEKWRIESSGQGARLTMAHPGGGTVSMELDQADINDLIKDLGKLAE